MCSITQEEPSSPRNVDKASSTNAMSPSMLSGAVVVLGVGLFCNSLSYTGILSWKAMASIAAVVLGFLATIVAFCHIYLTKVHQFRKCSANLEFLATLGNDDVVSKENLHLSECLADLDKIATPEGLHKMWMDEIQSGDKEPMVMLLTGLTGYVGRAFLFQFLREMKIAEEASKKKLQHKVYVMARPKARKNLSAMQRLQLIRDEDMFSTVREQWDRCVVAAESGDLQEPNCGMSAQTLQHLEQAGVTHVCHCAADVNFNRPLADSAAINISPALQLSALANGWSTCRRFVHVSTAFVNPNTGTAEEPLREELFSLGKYDPQALYDSMRGDQKLALAVKKELAFQNNYVFTKCVSEHLMVRNNQRLELKIVRPAVVGPAWTLPSVGWNGDKPSTISGVFLLWGVRVIRFAALVAKPIPTVPVDVVAAGIIHAVIAPFASEPSNSDSSKPAATFRNLIWSHKSPKGFMEGVYMCISSLECAVHVNYLTALEAAVSSLLVDITAAVPWMFHILHPIFNLGPLFLLQFVCWFVRQLNIKTELTKVPMAKLFNFSEMLSLYRPYMGREYNFESSIDVPESVNEHVYCGGLLYATYQFISKMFPSAVPDISEVQLLPPGRFDMWWALTFPCRYFKDRFMAYFAAQIIRARYDSCVMSLSSAAEVARVMAELDRTMDKQKHCVVLAPTLRSDMDFIVAKYMPFCTAGLGFDIPHVFAGDEVENSTTGATLNKIKSAYDRHATLCPFLGGSPSADGRLQQPHAQFLQTLANSPGGHDYTVIPVCIDYDRIDAQDLPAHGTNLGLASMFSLYLKLCVFGEAQESLGGIRVIFGVPKTLKDAAHADAMCEYIQSEHLRVSTISGHHLAAAEKYLKIPFSTLKSAAEQVGVSFRGSTLAKTDGKQKKQVVETAEECLYLHMQWIYRFAPFLSESHPKWAKWIMNGAKMDKEKASMTKTNEIEAVLKVLCASFDNADAAAECAMRSLSEKKVDTSSVPVSDFVKEMKSLADNSANVGPCAFYQVAASLAASTKA